MSGWFSYKTALEQIRDLAFRYPGVHEGDLEKIGLEALKIATETIEKKKKEN